jgi:hypothetical protein
VSSEDKFKREMQKLRVKLDVIAAGTHWRENDMRHVAGNLNVHASRVNSIIKSIESMQDVDTLWRTAITLTEYTKIPLDIVHAWIAPLTLTRTDKAEPCDDSSDDWLEQVVTAVNAMWCRKLLDDKATVPSLELVRAVRQRNVQNFTEQYEGYNSSDDFDGCFESFELRIGITVKPKYKSSSSSDDDSSDESVEKTVGTAVGTTVKSDTPVSLNDEQHAPAEAATSHNCVVA